MNPIVQPDDFVDELEIAHVDTDKVAKQLNRMIEKYQEEVLEKLLGSDLLALYEAGVAISPPAAQWGKLAKLAKPVIAGVVYYWYVRNNHTTTASLGEIKGKSQNSISANPEYKMVKNWNDAVDAAFRCAGYISENSQLYGNYYFSGYSYHDRGWNVRCLPDIFQYINTHNI